MSMLNYLNIQLESKNLNIEFRDTSDNKRGTCHNYLPLLIGDKWFEEVVKMAQHKTTKEYQNLVKREFEYLMNIKKDENFKNTHPFWKKEDQHLLNRYISLYNKFRNAFQHNKKTSKNIISTEDDTCISLFQYRDDVLHVVQRSCDLSCGFLADALSIELMRQYTGATSVVWIIIVPHVYDNNLAETIKYFSDYNNKARKFKFNVR